MSLGPCLYARHYPDCARKGLYVINGTTIRGLEHKPNFVCTCLLFRALGIRWLGSGKLRGRGDEKSAEDPSEGYSLQHVPCDGTYTVITLIATGDAQILL